jgi:hypothetical protein
MFGKIRKKQKRVFEEGKGIAFAASIRNLVGSDIRPVGQHFMQKYIYITNNDINIINKY